LELGFLKDRLLLDAEWYRNRCGNQLVQYNLPAQTGFSDVTQNFQALVQNTGLELTLTSTNMKTKVFAWRTALNVTIARNKLVSFPGIATSSYYETYAVGKSLSEKFGFRYAGINDTTGVYQFRSSKGGVTSNPVYTYDGLTLNDQGFYGNTDPKFFGGLTNSFSFKGFQLDLTLQFRKTTGTNYLGQINQNLYPGFMVNEPTVILDRWQHPYEQTDIAKFSAKFGSPAYDGRNYLVESSGIYSDASYIRLKTLSVSYMLPASYLNKIKVQSCRIYCHVQNLFTLTDYKIGDPETQSIYGVPPMKTVTAGLQFTF